MCFFLNIACYIRAWWCRRHSSTFEPLLTEQGLKMSRVHRFASTYIYSWPWLIDYIRDDITSRLIYSANSICWRQTFFYAMSWCFSNCRLPNVTRRNVARIYLVWTHQVAFLKNNEKFIRVIVVILLLIKVCLTLNSTNLQSQRYNVNCMQRSFIARFLFTITAWNICAYGEDRITRLLLRKQ